MTQKTETRSLRKGAKIKTARRLRKALTKPELWLWLRLKTRTDEGVVFRNQHPLGPYILDFYCAKARLCIEVDGEIHTRDHQKIHDEARDAWLKAEGIYVHRVIARDLLANPDETAQGIIDLALERLTASPPPFGWSPLPINGESEERYAAGGTFLLAFPYFPLPCP